MKPITPDDQPDIVPIRDARFFRVGLYRCRTPWRWIYNDITIISDRGYEFDGASTPRLVWSLTGYTPDGIHRASALAHDIGCDHRGRLYDGRDFDGVETEYVLYGRGTNPTRHGCPVKQMSSQQVHRMWQDLLEASEGHRPAAAKMKGFFVRTLGPRWKRDFQPYRP